MGRETVIERLSASHSGQRKTCVGCSTVDGLAEIIDEESDRTNSVESRVTVAEQRLSRHDTEIAVLAERVLLSVDGLRREFAAAVTASGFERAGKDIRASTPAGRLPEIKAGSVAIRGPVWLVLAVVVFVTLALGAFAAGAYVAAQWGPPSKVAPIAK